MKLPAFITRFFPKKSTASILSNLHKMRDELVEHLQGLDGKLDAEYQTIADARTRIAEHSAEITAASRAHGKLTQLLD